MNRSWFQILTVAMLLGLLVLLAGLQYAWLGQISEGEHARLQKRLETDSEKFAEDFNKEIRSAYFTFQLEADGWREKNFSEFNTRYDAWRQQTAFPALIKDFYFVRRDELLRYDANSKTFQSSEWTQELANLREKFKTEKDFEPIDERNFTLVMPIYENANPVSLGEEKNILQLTKLPEKFGFLIIKLDENVIKNEIFPALIESYFSDNENAAYKLAVVNKEDEGNVIFNSQSNAEITKQTSDASVPLFNLSPDNFAVFINRKLLSEIGEIPENKRVIINQKVERKDIDAPSESKGKILKIQNPNGGKTTVLQGSKSGEKRGRWLLNAQHSAGSLENFVANTRRKNLVISFGILSLLAASVILIFLSARRAQILAQRQVDFVSAVSHEFRTPLAVIYSAGENLTDGVVQNEKQVAQYGSLIKREGKKLSAMVEQILEFAGARSGRKKYDLRETEVEKIIKNALAECQPLIEEKDFTVETNIAENLPKVSVDVNALSHAVQNLITNAVKFSNGEKWFKVSAENEKGSVKITVEDKGIGITPKDISKIFTPFYRAKDVVDAQIHGNGLGLSLVKQTVEAHGGKVSAESETGRGSKFTIELPEGN